MQQSEPRCHKPVTNCHSSSGSSCSCQHQTGTNSTSSSSSTATAAAAAAAGILGSLPGWDLCTACLRVAGGLYSWVTCQVLGRCSGQMLNPLYLQPLLYASCLLHHPVAAAPSCCSCQHLTLSWDVPMQQVCVCVASCSQQLLWPSLYVEGAVGQAGSGGGRQGVSCVCVPPSNEVAHAANLSDTAGQCFNACCWLRSHFWELSSPMHVHL